MSTDNGEGATTTMSITRGLARLAPAALALLAVAACSAGDQPKVDAPTTSTSPTGTTPTPSATASSTPSVPPDAQEAVRAYENYQSALRNAQMNPPARFGDPLSPAADYRKYTFDPERVRIASIIAKLSVANQAYRGEPPRARATVLSASPDAKPYPLVSLRVCYEAASSKWEQYDRKTKKTISVVPLYDKPVLVDVIYYQKHWGVSRTAKGEGKCAQ